MDEGSVMSFGEIMNFPDSSLDGGSYPDNSKDSTKSDPDALGRKTGRSLSTPAVMGAVPDSFFEDIKADETSGKLYHATFFENLGGIFKDGLIPQGARRKKSRSLALTPRHGGVFCAASSEDIEGLSRRPDVLIEIAAEKLAGMAMKREKDDVTVAVEGVIAPEAFHVGDSLI